MRIEWYTQGTKIIAFCFIMRRNLVLKGITDNNFFWKTIKPLFSGMIKTSNTMILLEKDTPVIGNSEIAKNGQILSNVLKTLKFPDN